MSPKMKAMCAGALVLAAGLAIYFFVRVPSLEREYAGALVRTTNALVAGYREMEKRAAGENRKIGPADLSEFLKKAQERFPRAAVLAVTDESLSVRLSIKNDRYVRSAALFENILSDFARDRFTASRSDPYVVRYYGESGADGAGRARFYIFISRIGPYRLLSVYPYDFRGMMLMRTLLELALVAALAVMMAAALFIALTRKPAARPADDRASVDLDLARVSAGRGEDAGARATMNVMADTLAGYVRGMFEGIRAAHGAESVSLYLNHPPARLVKIMELKGTAFLRIDSATFDSFDIDNEAGRDLRDGATMVLEGGRRIILPMIHGGSFLGVVAIAGAGGFDGGRVAAMKDGVASIMKNVHDFLKANDVMTDAASGLHSKIFYNLKLAEAKNLRRGGGRHFSVMFVDLFRTTGPTGVDERSSVIRLAARSIMDIVSGDVCLCRYDDCIALVLGDVDARRAREVSRAIARALEKYRIRIRTDVVIRLAPVIGVSSTDTLENGEDMTASAIKNLRIH